MSTENWYYGADGKLYFGAVDTALVSLTVLGIAKDVSVTLEKTEVDANKRANGRWARTRPGHKSLSIEFDIEWQPTDAGFIALRDAFLNETPLRLAALSGARDVSGSQGPMGEFFIYNFPISQQLQEGQSVSVTAKLDTFVEWVSI